MYLTRLTALATVVLTVFLATSAQVRATVIITDGNTGLDWTVIDNDLANDADGTFDFTGEWERVVLGGNAFAFISRRAEGALPESVATWTFFNLDPGTYEVAASWDVRPGTATDGAPYSINGGTPFVVSQLAVPTGPPNLLEVGGGGNDVIAYQVLSSDAVVLGDGMLTVVLTNNTNGRVMADSIAIRQVGAPIPEPSTYLVFTGLALCFGVAGWWRKRRQAA